MSYAGQYISGAQFRLLYVFGESTSNEAVKGSLLFCEETQIQLPTNKVLRIMQLVSDSGDYAAGNCWDRSRWGDHKDRTRQTNTIRNFGTKHFRK